MVTLIFSKNIQGSGKAENEFCVIWRFLKKKKVAFLKLRSQLPSTHQPSSLLKHHMKKKEQFHRLCTFMKAEFIKQLSLSHPQSNSMLFACKAWNEVKAQLLGGIDFGCGVCNEFHHGFQTMHEKLRGDDISK